MFGFKKEKIYCAVDIEATGFDPLNEEILEIGFAFFKLGDKGFEVIEEWSQVFKPTKTVSTKILGLTGITEEEIANAPKLSELHQFVQKKLAKATLLGHSVGVDVKYLEANGFKLSGKYIDTLELVQFILPTHHSYNLENLMHFFGIPHIKAHRALGDAKATIQLLESLLGVFADFPAELKSRIKTIIAPYKCTWEELLNISVPIIQLAQNIPTPRNLPRLSGFKFQLSAQSILAFEAQDYKDNKIFSFLAEDTKQYLFVSAHKHETLELWKAGFGEAVFTPEDTFDKKKLESLLSEKKIEFGLVKFLIKVLVWSLTNWQTTTILDLNLSFAGNQFRALVCGQKSNLPAQAKILLCDQQTFLMQNKEFSDSGRFLIIRSLAEFESQLSAKIGRRVTWGTAVRLLNGFYNPETDLGDLELKNQVLDLLVATDLFFGIAVMSLQSLNIPEGQVGKETLELNAQIFGKIHQAAESYSAKLEIFSKANDSQFLQNFIFDLRSFFKDEPGRVKWVDFGQRFCAFNNLPLEIEDITNSALKGFNEVSFLDTLTPELANYFQIRLGLHNFKYVKVESENPSNKIQLFVSSTPTSNNKLQEQVAFGLPAVLIFPSYKYIKDFYDAHYFELRKSTAIFAEGYSGGVNKMFYNFNSVNNGLLIITANLALKHTKQSINAKTLILSDFPAESGQNLYAAAVEKHMLPRVPEIGSLRVLQNLHKILHSFYSPSLAEVYLYNQAKTPDSKLVRNYLNTLNFAEIIEI